MKSLSLFSGCLGLDKGLEESGITTVAYVEKDITCRETIQMNRPNIPIIDDVFSIDYSKYKNKIDIIVGGPPCQSFSTAGKRKFLSDPRGAAINGFVKAVKIIKPNFFILENVKGITSSGVVEILYKKFKSLGYNVKYEVLNTYDYGVAQNRLRFIMIGCFGEKNIEMPKPLNKKYCFKDVTKNIKNCEFIPFSSKTAEIMKKIPEGGNWKNLENQEVLGNANKNSGGLTGFYRRLSFDRPSPTLTTSPLQKMTTLAHPMENRPLSVEEYKRIQGFPDKWKLAGNTTQKYRQLGNAVPVKFAKQLGLSILSV